MNDEYFKSLVLQYLASGIVVAGISQWVRIRSNIETGLLEVEIYARAQKKHMIRKFKLVPAGAKLEYREPTCKCG